MKRRNATGIAVAGLLLASANSFAAFTNGPPTDPNFFEIGVWYQNLTSTIVNGYKAMGVNTYVYPDTMTQSQLNLITNAGLYTVMPQNSLGLANLTNKTIIGWFNPPDEPDNAQPATGGGYTDPILPATIISQYNTLKANDSTRPILLNLGQGVAWDNWVGRGARTDHPEDYPASTTLTWTNGTVYHQGYLAGSDIGAFDFYPMNATNSQVAGKINLLGAAVDRLRSDSAAGHPVWNYIETTNIDTTDTSPGPTPTQVKAEVWLSIVHGSMGIIYFAHQFPEPPNATDALLLDPVMNPAVTAINAQIKTLAPVLNTATVQSATITTGTSSNVHADIMTKTLADNAYLFSVADQNSSGPALFKDPSLAGVSGTVTVLGENRTLSMSNGSFVDFFAASGVHLYEMIGRASFAPSVTTPILLGDANLDGTVNFDDFLVLSQNFGQAGAWSQGNFVNDPTVDFNDFLTLSQHFGQSLTGPSFTATPDQLAAMAAFIGNSSSTPEPASLTLLALGSAALLLRRPQSPHQH